MVKQSLIEQRDRKPGVRPTDEPYHPAKVVSLSSLVASHLVDSWGVDREHANKLAKQNGNPYLITSNDPGLGLSCRYMD